MRHCDTPWKRWADQMLWTDRFGRMATVALWVHYWPHKDGSTAGSFWRQAWDLWREGA